MISLPIWIRHLGVLTYEDSACTDENDSGDGDQLSEIYQFNRRSGTKGRFIDLISGDMEFSGESIVSDYQGKTVAIAGRDEELLITEVNLSDATITRKKKPYTSLRKPELYS